MHGRLRTRRMSHRVRLCVRSLLLLILPVLIVPALGHAQTSNRAGLVIVKGDGSVQTSCVAFDEPEISGLALLERSGLDIVIQPAGNNATICSIAGEGCAFPREACWCQCAGGGPCRYWSYWHRNGGAWQYSATGAPLYRVPPGGVDAWVWGENAGNTATRPPEIAFDAICPVPAAEPTLVPPPPTDVPPAATLPPPTAVPPTATMARPARPVATATELPVAQPTATKPRPSATLPPATHTSTTLPQATATSVPPQATATATATEALPAPSQTSESPQSGTGAGAALDATATVTPSPVRPTKTAIPSTTATTVPPKTLVTPEPPAATGTSATEYVLFGGTAGVLLLALTLAWRRRR
jgi:hypothetical protein